MITIQRLLNRIHWGDDCAQGEFVIGYYDRVEDHIIKVLLQKVYFDPDDHFSFQLYDEDDELHSILYHRADKVYKKWRGHHATEIAFSLLDLKPHHPHLRLTQKENVDLPIP